MILEDESYELCKRLFKKYPNKSVVSFSPLNKKESDFLFNINKKNNRVVKTLNIVNQVKLNGSIFLVSPDNIRKYKSFFKPSVLPLVQNNIEESIDLDMPDDWKFAEILKKQSKNYKNLIVKNWVNFNELQSVFGLADVLLVSLSKDASEFSVPSKILNYFYSGKPILGMMPKQNLASKKILKLKCGYIAEPDNFNIFLNKAQKLYKSKTLRKKMGLNALNYAKKYFDIEAITNKFENIFINSQN